MRVVVFLGTCSPPAPRPFYSYRCGAPSPRPLQQVLDVCVCVCVWGALGICVWKCWAGRFCFLRFSAFLAISCRYFAGASRQLLRSLASAVPHSTEYKGKWRKVHKQNLKTTLSALARHTRRCFRICIGGWRSCAVCCCSEVVTKKELFVCLCGWVCVCVGGKSEKQKLVENIQQKVKNEENRNEEGNKAQTGQNYLTTLQILHVVFVFLSLYWFYTGERVKRLFVCVCE